MSMDYDELLADAHAVLLPALATLELNQELRNFLRQGGRSVLFGETRAEYLARGMSDERRRGESASALQDASAAAAATARAPVLVCCDQELAGIQRAHDLVAPLPDLQTATAMTDDELEEACAHRT